MAVQILSLDTDADELFAWAAWPGQLFPTVINRYSRPRKKTAVVLVPPLSVLTRKEETLEAIETQGKA
jgi:hypothetical protein